MTPPSTGPDRDPLDCLHTAAHVEAYIGNPGNPDPASRGLPWEVLHPAPSDLDGIRAVVTLGVCPQCSSRVVSVRAFDAVNWTPEHGTAWTSRWTRLVRDGEV
jgi:hypothetical protein